MTKVKRSNSPTPSTAGYVVWRAWRDGMLAQGREVAPERMAWETLPDRDKELDAVIAEALTCGSPKRHSPTRRRLI